MSSAGHNGRPGVRSKGNSFTEEGGMTETNSPAELQRQETRRRWPQEGETRGEKMFLTLVNSTSGE